MKKKFSSYAEYERWTDTFENPSDYEEIPVAIEVLDAHIKAGYGDRIPNWQT